MRVTNSMDGVKRVNKRVTHRLAGYDFANILCLTQRDDVPDEDDELPDLTRAQILARVDKVLTENPDARHWWRDDVEDGADELWEWADALTKKRFPELY